MKAIRLRTEYLKDPLGIDIQKPLLFWNCEGGSKQVAYRILAQTDGKTVWDSGKVASSSMRAEYPEKLVSRLRVEWKVKLWDESGEGERSEPAFFEMGLLSRSDRKAEWIAGNYKVNRKKRYPVDCFQKLFTAIGVQKARLYASACGLYEVRLNGTRVGNFVLAPGHTDYRKRIQYQTYDVTDLIKGGANIITAELADGWYRGSCGAWGLKNQYGTQTKFLAQLELVDSEGKVTRVCTDESWAWSNDGAILFADNKDGEIVDARKKPTYSGRAKAVKCSVMPSASNNVYVTEHERFTNPKVIKTPKGKTVLDFGQNIAGYVSFTVKAKAGQKATLRFGEMLDKDGELTLKNIQCSNKKIKTPLQKIEYVCKEGVNTYKTKFAVFGFQYMQYYYDCYLEMLGGLRTVSRVICKLPGGQKLMGGIMRKRFDQLARTEHGTLHFIEDNVEDHIDAYWGSRARWEALPEKLSQMKHFTDWDQVVPIDHGYDEEKPESELCYDDMKKVASFRGGKLLSITMQKGDWTTPLEFECAFGHKFQASPRLVLEGGHWCDECERKSWNYGARAKVDPFFAQVWNPLHGPDEMREYPKIVSELDVK